MGRLAMPHRGDVKVFPPRDLLEPFIERTENHWYWLGEFVEEVFERSAAFAWTAPGRSWGRFMVPKLLWQMAHPDEIGKRIMLENTCGLYTCINPVHWRKRLGGVKIPARIVLPESVEAHPVIYYKDVLNFLNVHIRRGDSDTTVCGRGIGYQAMAKTTVITCDECISTWVRLEQPFVEAP